MLPFFNQKELVVCSNQSQYQKYTSLLEKRGNRISNKSTRFIIAVFVFDGNP